DLHVIAVAQLSLIAAAAEEPAEQRRVKLLYAVLAAGGGDLGLALLRQLDGGEVEAHLLVRLERVVGLAAAGDAGIDAVFGELPLDALVEIVARRRVDEPALVPLLEPARELLDGDLGLADTNIDAGGMCNRRRWLVAPVPPRIGLVDGQQELAYDL